MNVLCPRFFPVPLSYFRAITVQRIGDGWPSIVRVGSFRVECFGQRCEAHPGCCALFVGVRRSDVGDSYVWKPALGEPLFERAGRRNLPDVAHARVTSVRDQRLSRTVSDDQRFQHQFAARTQQIAQRTQVFERIRR